MAEWLQHRRFDAGVVALAVGLALAGCGTPQDGGASPPTSPSSAPGVTSSAPSGGSGQSAPATADPSASGDWWPEQQKTMATGQQFPADYEPATLDHPARNVPEPVMPEEAKQETEAGAQAFLNYYADAQWYSFQTGDTSLVRAVTSTHCEKCLEQYDEVDHIYASDKWASGGLEKIEISPNSFSQRMDGSYILPILTDNFGVKIIDDGKVSIEQVPQANSEDYDVALARQEQEWVYVTASPRGSL